MRKSAPPASERKPKKPRSTEGREEAKAAATMTKEEWQVLKAGSSSKWPQPPYMSSAGKGGHTCYRDETYEIITRWMAKTRISYRPHAKSPGSKSHVRYEVYSKAKTVGEALELGSWPADWCWDFERGFIKFTGPVREEPVDTTQVTDDSVLTDVDRAIMRWYLRELAKKYGLKIEDLSNGRLQETLIMRAHRLVAQREALKRLEIADREKRMITEEEALSTLREWSFARNKTRINVQPEGQDWVWSDTVGLLRDRQGNIHLTNSTKNYPAVITLLNRYLTDRIPPEMASFSWTSMNLNCNYAAKLHRDGNNFGPSFIKAFGDFTGGELNYWPEDDRTANKLEDLKPEDAVQLDLKKHLAMFNGNCGHSVADFTGDRYSIVYFTIGAYDKAPDNCKEELRKLGVNYPSSDADRYELMRPPAGYAGKNSNKGAAAKGERRAFYSFPTAELEVKGKNSGTTPMRRGVSEEQTPGTRKTAGKAGKRSATNDQGPKAKKHRT